MLVTPDTLVYRRQHDKERDLPVYVETGEQDKADSV